MASVFDEKCTEKEKGVLNMRKPVLNPTIQQVTVNLYNKLLSNNTECLILFYNMSSLSYIFDKKI